MGPLVGIRFNVYQLRVLESFRGAQKVGDIIDVQTGMGGGDCGYRFVVGSKYLVDGWNQDGVLHTGICSITALLDSSGAELRILRAIASHQPLPDLIGVIKQYDGPPTEGPIGPLVSTPVKLQTASGGQPAYATTDATGFFSFSGVPPGQYIISLSLPPTLTPGYTNLGRIVDQQLPLITIEKDAGMVCHADIVVVPSAAIQGIVKSSDGKVDGWVNADTVKPDGTPSTTAQSTAPEADGTFSLEHLKPGRYRIQFIERQGFVRGEPQILDLKDGERKTGIVLIAK